MYLLILSSLRVAVSASCFSFEFKLDISFSLATVSSFMRSLVLTASSVSICYRSLVSSSFSMFCTQ